MFNRTHSQKTASSSKTDSDALCQPGGEASAARYLLQVASQPAPELTECFKFLKPLISVLVFQPVTYVIIHLEQMRTHYSGGKLWNSVKCSCFRGLCKGFFGCVFVVVLGVFFCTAQKQKFKLKVVSQVIPKSFYKLLLSKCDLLHSVFKYTLGRVWL